MTLPMESADTKNDAFIRFSEEDLTLFSEASGDRNPLHMSALYASRTAYGQQVVFGALGALACLGRANFRAGDRITELTADFHRPLFLQVDYAVKVSEKDGTQFVRLFDGTVLLTTVSIVFSSSAPGQGAVSNVAGSLFKRTEAVERSESDLGVGTNVSGRYRADPSKLALLRQRWNITADPFIAETLLWGSYVVGMELPGRNAVFFKFALKFEGDAAPGPLVYEVTVSRITGGIGQLRMAVSLSSEGRQVASGHFLSFVRAEVDRAGTAGEALAAPVSGALRGKVALVIGASRGLGRATAAALAMQGAHVIATSRSEGVDFTAVCPPDAAARITHERGDAADHQWLVEVRDRVTTAHGRLDILVCNAFPAIPAFRLELAALSRIEAYLSRATALVLAPLCAFLELLNESDGCAVVISSMAVEEPVREWPHYVAAKRAIEAFANIAPLQYPRTSALIVRPERLLTEMTNTPMGRRNAVAPARMANEMIERLQNPLRPGSTEILRGARAEEGNPAAS